MGFRIKKRNIISVLITCVILLCSNNFWLDKKPVNVQFNLTGHGEVKVKAMLSYGIFNSDKVVKTINLDKDNKVNLKINNVLKFNKAKIFIDSNIAGGVTL